MTTFDDFVIAVLKMRTAQKEYFKKPIPGRLIHAKQLEKQVDEEIERHHGALALPFKDAIPPDEIPY